MNKKNFRNIAWVLAICLVMTVVFSPVIPVSYAEPLNPAFPGAEGGGMWTTGARDADSIEVYHVTKLGDDGSTGTIRDAVSKPNRIIVFDVAGNIELLNTLTIKSDNLTILGQTAPGDGICLKNYNTYITGNNIIVRYLRFRMGDAETIEDDSLGGRGLNNIIIDHCSVSWSVDECASFYQNKNFTMQWCIISESLKQSAHAKGNHGYAGIWGGTNATYHHNLIAHHDSRNPRVSSQDSLASYKNITAATELTDLRNNVVYNWGGNSAYGGENGMPINIVNCYYKYGPATSAKSRIFQMSAKAATDAEAINGTAIAGWGPEIYVDGNYVYGNSNVTSNNQSGVDRHANTKEYHIYTAATLTDDAKTVHERYINDYPITTQTAEDAYTSVLAGSGASIARDSVDARIINEVKTGKAPNGTKGIINSPSDVGGYPTLNGKKSKDSDNDGIPNEWEDKMGLDKFDITDGTRLTSSGYTNVEEYANALADASYVRDVDYDPSVDDYVPSETSTSTPTPIATPETELLSSWVASPSDITKKAGQELMPGLSLVIQLPREMTDTRRFADGSVYNYAITHKDISGGWDLVNKVATGSALKFVAPKDGIFTIYATGVSVDKTFYLMPEGADTVDDAVFTLTATESNKPVICQYEMKAGEVYYYFIAGSKARYAAARYEGFVTPPPTLEPGQTPLPTAEPTPEPPKFVDWDFGKEPFTVDKDGVVNPDTELFPNSNVEGKNNYNVSPGAIDGSDKFDGLEYILTESQTGNYQPSSKEFTDGYKSTWGIKTTASTETNGVFSFTLDREAAVKVYAQCGSSSGGTNLYLSEGTYDSQTASLELVARAPQPLTPLVAKNVSAGKVFIHADAKTQIYRIVVDYDNPSAEDKYKYKYKVIDLSVADTKTTFNIVKNDDIADNDDTLIVAYYDENDILVDIETEIISKSLSKDSITSYTIEKGIASGGKVRVFIWNSLDSMNPLSLIKEY